MKFSHISLWTIMYPPDLCGLMHPSSTGVLLGFSLLVIQPSSVLPSKSRSQPSAFSFAVSSLSAADKADAARRRVQRESGVRIEAPRGVAVIAAQLMHGAQPFLLPLPRFGGEGRGGGVSVPNREAAVLGGKPYPLTPDPSPPQSRGRGGKRASQPTTLSALASHASVFRCRYASTASLIATMVAHPSSALQYSCPPLRITSRKFPTRSRRGLTASFASSFPSFFAWNSGFMSPLDLSVGSPPRSSVPCLPYTRSGIWVSFVSVLTRKTVNSCG